MPQSFRTVFFFLMLPLPPRSTLFPYTTLFRSGVVIARQKRRRVVTERKASLHTDALDAGRLWLKRNADTERGHIRCVVPWTAVGHFSRVTEPKIVHKPRRKKVSFMSQEVLRGNRKR